MKKMVKRIKKALSRHKAIKKIYAITLLVLQTTRSTIRMHIGRLMRGGGIYPKYLSLPITHKCNLDCIMCGLRKQARDKDFTPSELDHITKNALFGRIETVGIHGGEPFTKTNLMEYVDILIKNMPRLKRLEFTSNGYFTKNILSTMKEIKQQCGQRGIEVFLGLSLDAVGDLHDFIRGQEGVFDRISETCVKLLENRAAYCDGLSLICTINKHNVYSLNEVETWAAWKGIPVSYDFAVENGRLLNTDRYDDFTIFNDPLARKMTVEFFYQKYRETLSPKYFSLYYFLVYKKRLGECIFKNGGGFTLTPGKQIVYCTDTYRELGDALQNGADTIFYGNLDFKKKLADERCGSCSHWMTGLTWEGLGLFVKDILHHRWVFH